MSAIPLACLASSLSGLIFGYDIGGTGGTLVMPSFREFAGWVESPDGQETREVATMQGWLNAVFSLGCMAGAASSGWCVGHLGRKGCMLLMSFVFVVGGSLQLAAQNMNSLLIGRGIGGFAIGGLSGACSLYISEIAPPNLRGRLVTIQQLAITFGILLAASANVGLSSISYGWRLSYGGNTTFAVLLLMLLQLLPESPHHLVSVGKEAEGRQALQTLRGKNANIDSEMNNIVQEAMQKLRRLRVKCKDLCSDSNVLRRLLIGMGIQTFQQLTGINAVMFYCPVIFNSFLPPLEAIIANLGIMSINFCATFIALCLVDRLGRRPLLIFGAAGMAVACFSLSMLSYSIETTRAVYAVSLVSFLSLHITFFAASWGPLGWLIPAEILPLRLRASGIMVTSLCNWTGNFAVALCTPLMLLYFGIWGTFLFFACCCAVMGLFAFAFVPELKGIDLSHVAEAFESFKLRRKATKVVSKVKVAPEVGANDNMESIELDDELDDFTDAI